MFKNQLILSGLVWDGLVWGKPLLNRTKAILAYLDTFPGQDGVGCMWWWLHWLCDWNSDNRSNSVQLFTSSCQFNLWAVIQNSWSVHTYVTAKLYKSTQQLYNQQISIHHHIQKNINWTWLINLRDSCSIFSIFLIKYFLYNIIH